MSTTTYEIPKTMKALLVRPPRPLSVMTSPSTLADVFSTSPWSGACVYVQIHKQGGPEEIKFEDVPVPTLEEGEVLVKVSLPSARALVWLWLLDRTLTRADVSHLTVI